MFARAPIVNVTTVMSNASKVVQRRCPEEQPLMLLSSATKDEPQNIRAKSNRVKKICTHSLVWQILARYCHRNSGCLSVCLSVTLVSHTKTVQDIEIVFAPYDTILFEDSSRQISWS